MQTLSSPGTAATSSMFWASSLVSIITQTKMFSSACEH